MNRQPRVKVKKSDLINYKTYPYISSPIENPPPTKPSPDAQASSSVPTTDIRIQFALISDSSTINSLTKQLTKYGLPLDGAFFLTIDYKLNIFKFVVGTAMEQSEADVMKVKTLLTNMGIRFSQKEIVKFFHPNNFNAFSTLYQKLIANLTLISIYKSNDNNLYIETSSLNTCVKILNFKEFYHDTHNL